MVRSPGPGGQQRRPIGPRTCRHCGATLALSLREAGRKQFCDEACRSAFRRATRDAVTAPVSVPSGVPRSVTVGDGGAGRPGGTREGDRAPSGTGSASQHVRFTPDSDRDSLPTWDASSQVNARFPDGRGAPQSRYYAKFAAAPGSKAGPERRFITQRLRSVLRDVSTIDRCKRCGREIVGTDVALVLREGVAHISGVETCGRIWLCPVCSAKIRVRRGEEVAIGVGDWITAGHACLFLTATLPHDHGDALAASLSVLAEAWRHAATQNRSGKRDRDLFGVVGTIKSIEITHGANGWHPHIHAVILLEEDIPLIDETGNGRQMSEFYARWDARWAAALRRVGWSEGLPGIRLRVDMVQRSTVAGLAAYVTKLQTGDGRGLGNEIARADLKGGRKKSRTPFEILADFGTTGDAGDLELWHEYEEATKGRSAIRWSRGLRKLIAPDLEDKTDEEIAAEEIGGQTVAYIRPDLWYRLADIPGGDALVLDALETGGLQAVLRTLVALRLDPDGLIPAEDSESP